MALDDSTVKFEIWDTAGQERYRSLAPMYYRGASAAIVVYDITNPDSFTGAKSWVKELQRRGDPNVVIALAGNKADLESRRKVQFEEANSYAEENGILHLETSAKNANNVKALFVEIAKKLPKNPPQPEREAFPLTAPQHDNRSCCWAVLEAAAVYDWIFVPQKWIKICHVQTVVISMKNIFWNEYFHACNNYWR